MAFPSSPTNGQQATVNNITYYYNSSKSAWIVVGSIPPVTTVANLVAASIA
jgi:hypothetical protein